MGTNLIERKDIYKGNKTKPQLYYQKTWTEESARFCLLYFCSYCLRVLYTLRQTIPFIQPHILLKLCLFQSQRLQVIHKIFQKLVNPLSGSIVYQENPLTSRIDKPLLHHWDIGVGRMDLGDNTNHRPQDKITSAWSKKAERFICRLNDSHNIRFKRKTCKTHAEPFGFCILSGESIVSSSCIGILRF